MPHDPKVGQRDDGSYQPDYWQAGQIRHALRRYRDRHGVFPDSLDRLVEADGNLPPLLEGGPRALLDLQSQRYQWEVRVRGGVEDVVVWTTLKSGRRIQNPYSD